MKEVNKYKNGNVKHNHRSVEDIDCAIRNMLPKLDFFWMADIKEKLNIVIESTEEGYVSVVIKRLVSENKIMCSEVRKGKKQFMVL